MMAKKGLEETHISIDLYTTKKKSWRPKHTSICKEKEIDD